MVELPKMTELVHDEIVGELRRQEREFVAEVEVAFARTAPPAGALVADAYAAVGEGVRRREHGIKTREMFEPCMRDGASGFFVEGKSAATCGRDDTAGTTDTATSNTYPYSPSNDPEEWHSRNNLLSLSHTTASTLLVRGKNLHHFSVDI